MVYQTLKRRILRAQLPPHSRLIEREIADSLSVSRTPVREALARLEHDGFLRAVAGRQRSLLEVTPLTARELRQTSAATAALEGIGAAEAASQPDKARLKLAAQLTSLIDDAAREIGNTSGSFARALELDERFHRTLADKFLEPALKASVEVVRAHVYRYTWTFSRGSGVDVRRFRAEHLPIIRALRAGNGNAIQNSLRANWSGFAARILPFLEGL